MLCLKSFQTAYLFDDFEIEFKEEIFRKYKYALIYIGVDLTREDVQEALLNCLDGFEDGIRATIAYWYWLTENSQPFYANATLIQALSQRWGSYHWKEEYLDNPNFQNPCQLWWQQAALNWGADFRNQTIVDVKENDSGEHILLRTGETLSLNAAKRWGWDRLKEYILQQQRQAEEQQRYGQRFHDACHSSHNPIATTTVFHGYPLFGR